MVQASEAAKGDDEMPNNLFFIPLIEKALQAVNTKAALRVALNRIVEWGRKPEYQRGFLQFERLMKEVNRRIEERAILSNMCEIVAEDFMLQAVTGLMADDQEEMQAILDLIHSNPRWEGCYRKLQTEGSKSEWSSKHRPTVILIEKNGEMISSIPIGDVPITRTIRPLTPGFFTARLSTGRMLWENESKQKDLVWSKALLRKDLDLATGTDARINRMTKEICLFENKLVLQIHPEVECGQMVVQITEGGT